MSDKMNAWQPIEVWRQNSLRERLRAGIKVKPISECWEWQRAKWNGYGRIVSGSRCNGTRRTYSTHRASYEVFIGEIPDGMDVCHKCDNRGCINPDHLFIGTRKDNMHDCIAKGRFVFPVPQKGYSHHQAKLTPEQVSEIQGHKGSSGGMGRIYGISDRHFRSVRSGEYFKPEPPK